VAVDAAEEGVGRANPRGQENDIFFIVSGLDKAVGDFFFQIEDLADGGSVRDGNLIPEAVDDNHDIFFGFSRYLEDIEACVFEVGPEMTSEIGNARYAGQRRQGEGHALARPRKLGDAAQRAGGKDQGIFRVEGRCLGRYSSVKKVEPQGPASDEVVADLRIEVRNGDGAASQIYAEGSVGVAAFEFRFREFHLLFPDAQ